MRQIYEVQSVLIDSFRGWTRQRCCDPARGRGDGGDGSEASLPLQIMMMFLLLLLLLLLPVNKFIILGICEKLSLTLFPFPLLPPSSPSPTLLLSAAEMPRWFEMEPWACFCLCFCFCYWVWVWARPQIYYDESWKVEIDAANGRMVAGGGGS